MSYPRCKHGHDDPNHECALCSMENRIVELEKENAELREELRAEAGAEPVSKSTATDRKPPAATRAPIVTVAEFGTEPPIGPGSEPGPLVGEGELKQKRLLREIGELEAAHSRVFDEWGEADGGSRAESRTWKEVEVFRDRLASKRKELTALDKAMALRTKPSPTA